MIDIKQKIKHWLIPPGWYNAGKRIFANPKQQEFEFDLSLIDYKGKHKGERVFILASGPSINTQDLTLLRNEYCIAVSQFFLHPQINEIRPQYHCFAPQHYPFNDETNKIIFDNFKNNYKYPVKTFVGTREYDFSYYNFLKKNPEYCIDASFIDYSNSSQLNENNFMNEGVWNITKNPFGIRTVVYVAIQVAYYMQFKKIYLLGADHDYLKDLSINRNEHHFYQENQSFNDKEHLNMFSTERWFEEYYYRWKQYRLMKDFLSTKGVTVYNATNGGMLDVFERVNYDHLFV